MKKFLPWILAGTFFIVGVATLALYPMVFAEAHINIKDPVQMGYFTIATVSGYFTITRRPHPDLLLSA